MAATGQLKERIQLLQAAKARAESLGKTLKPEVQKELDSYSSQGLLGSSAAGAAGGKVSEGERKTAFLATRLAGSLDQLNDVPADQQRPGWFQEAVRGVAPEAIANSLTGSDRQRVEAAQGDILDAALTLGTGAAYTKEQLTGYRKSYFPQLGDSDEVIKDKTKRLNTLLQSARIGAGGAAPQIDEALKKSGFAVPGATEAKGGDPKSGTTGAAVAAGGQPPAGPTPPSGPDSRGGVQFNGEGPQLAAGVSKLSPEAQEKLYQFSLTKPNAAQLKQYYDTLGAGVLPDANAQQIADYYGKGGTERIGVSYDKAEVAPVDAGDGSVGAAARGAGNALTLGFLDEAGALADTVTQGGTYDQNLDRRRGQELFDEQNSGVARFAGQMVGSLPLGGIEFAGARAASRAAGVAAIRQGLGREVAAMQANRTFAMRSAMEGAGIGAVYGAGEAEGGLGDRAIGAAGGAAFGGAAAGALSLGGGAVLARRAAAARGVAPALTEGQQTLAAMERQGITPLPADVGGTATRMATSGVAQTIGGGGAVRRAAQATVDTSQAVRDRVAASLGMATNPEAAGEAARAGADQYIRTTGQRIGRIYDVAESAGGQARVDTPDALRVLNQEIGPLEESPVASPGLAVLQGLRDALQQPNTIRGLRNMRTAVRDQFEATGLRGSNIQRVADRVVTAATDDIVNGLRSQGLDRAANAYRRADRLWSERLRVIDDELEPILGKNTEKSGEQIVGALKSAMSGNNRRFVGFLDALPANEQGIVRASLVQRLGQATKGNQDETGEVFSLSTFLTHWNDIGETAKNRLLGAEGRAALNDLARVASSAKQAQKFNNHSNSASALGVGGGAIKLAEGAAAYASVGKVLGLTYGAGRLLASPRFARWLARPPRVPTPAASQAWAERLTRIAKAEPAIAQDVLGIQSGLRRLTQGASVPATAQEGTAPAQIIDGQNSQQQAPAEGAQQ
ncbi:hypothetical protein [Sphingomonas sp. R86520]|uniref:hypothetical protein n=1 Tax=Sphingomonas sp. R86520 TaxID=3093859 RepID=UPI0036D330F0